ncbi:helix-turn-helix domain-containing protein [Dechloromonas sp. A34]|uniref:helix-turn-helix domain-containing protein n=1 Tax=Dechloromonas sp. A34 TaxID=447588 RepID=UPI0022492977|nr:helix-turn-helix domain-containing protein [Dechloromonas sp. A34]
MHLAEISAAIANTAIEAGCAVVGVVADANGETKSFGAGSVDRLIAGKISESLAAMISRFVRLCCQGDGQIGVSDFHSSNPRERATPFQSFDLKAAAAYLQMSPFTLRELTAAGTIPGAKIGRRWVFMQEKLTDYLRSEIERQTAGRGQNGLLIAPRSNTEAQVSKPKQRHRRQPPSLEI